MASGFAVLTSAPVAGRPAGGSTAPLVLDCARGVGGGAAVALRAACGPSLALDLRNSSGGPGLNEGCGSEHVQKAKALPEGFEDVRPGVRCASLDGDADRLVYFSPAPSGAPPVLFDGDRISVLFATYLGRVLCELNARDHAPDRPDAATAATTTPDAAGKLGIGVVQTAYANGASTRYVTETLALPVVRTKTGVKHLHAAAKRFDVGVYFEANGHGTVLFSDKFVQLASDPGTPGPVRGKLRALIDLVNQAVGDALSDLLLVEAALQGLGWGLEEWAALYQDLPSRMLKVHVADRSVVRTTDAETRTTAPAGLQDAVDSAVARTESGRAFVRPSGTEDVVRVYAEARTQGAADALAADVSELVRRFAGGVERP